MGNVSCIVASGMCTGCGACNVCENITFIQGALGFPVPKVSERCIGCGTCLTLCIFDPEREDD